VDGWLASPAGGGVREEQYGPGDDLVWAGGAQPGDGERNVQTLADERTLAVSLCSRSCLVKLAHTHTLRMRTSNVSAARSTCGANAVYTPICPLAPS
jgi:hypothetical protein